MRLAKPNFVIQNKKFEKSCDGFLKPTFYILKTYCSSLNALFGLDTGNPVRSFEVVYRECAQYGVKGDRHGTDM